MWIILSTIYDSYVRELSHNFFSAILPCSLSLSLSSFLSLFSLFLSFLSPFPFFAFVLFRFNSLCLPSLFFPPRQNNFWFLPFYIAVDEVLHFPSIYFFCLILIGILFSHFSPADISSVEITKRAITTTIPS